MSDLIKGMHYLFAGFGLITKPGLKRYVIIPLIINIVLFSLLFLVLRHYMSELNTWVAGYLPRWLEWLSVVIWLLFFRWFLFIIHLCVCCAWRSGRRTF